MLDVTVAEEEGSGNEQAREALGLLIPRISDGIPKGCCHANTAYSVTQRNVPPPFHQSTLVICSHAQGHDPELGGRFISQGDRLIPQDWKLTTAPAGLKSSGADLMHRAEPP